MSTVGIIANPVSGKDIRRLVAHGSVFDNQEKVRIVRRLLTGLEAVGVTRVRYMPDEYAIVPRAVQGLDISMDLAEIPIQPKGNQNDSVAAGQWVGQNGADAVIVLGGDGTCRAVAKKNNGKTPMLPISTGTNNVFPYMIEATIGGIAAGLIATGKVPQSGGVYRSCQLDVLVDGIPVDMALVDVAVYNDRFIASRAIWDMEKVSQLFLTRCRPDSIGLSAVGGQLAEVLPEEHRGLHLRLGRGGKQKVTAAIAPGLLREVRVRQWDFLEEDILVAVESPRCVLALDGERETSLKQGQTAMVRLSGKGPLVIDVHRTMSWARKNRIMVSQED
ncbi:ATP-NAD kinase family protein [Desulfospira joergensenii]|uniref:ATP-NAD kinase family protein n=1 Tax=Desulfospira joergensenii TaxID=53329 RepID=UPI0003B77161|nr:NAD(+)/NADH kinase [Desulfospira joergensenii]